MRPTRKPRVILIFLIALCGLFVMSYATRLAQKSSLESQIAAMQARIDEAQAEQAELQNEYETINLPDYLDRVARTFFDLVMPGDTVLVIVNEGSAAGREGLFSTNATTNPIDYRNFPVWQQWVVFFTTDTFALSLR